MGRSCSSLKSERVRAVTHRGVSWPQLLGLSMLCCLLAVSADAQTSRIKRISLMTPDLAQSIAFFTITPVKKAID